MSECTHHWTVTSECPFCLRDELVAARDDYDDDLAQVLARAKRAEADLAAARADIREMVEKAADDSLEGYRELGARAAAAENERDSLRAHLHDEHQRHVGTMDERDAALADLAAARAVLVKYTPLQKEAADTIRTLRDAAALHGNIMGRIAIALFGEVNNRTDEECVREIERWAKVVKAAAALADEGQEYDFDDIGLGRAAPNSYWEDLDEALDPDNVEQEGGR